MSCTTAALRIVERRTIIFTQPGDEERRLQSWSKGDYEVIKQDSAYFFEGKTTQLPLDSELDSADHDFTFLKRLFLIGVGVFSAGALLLVIGLMVSYHDIWYVGWPVMFLGAALAALALLRAQDLDQRG